VLAQPGTFQYSIGSYEASNSATPRALKIQNSSACSTSTQWYYVEARSSQSGVTVHRATTGSGDSSYLLDTTPATTAWSDAALLPGKSFTDPARGISITPTSVGSAGATVSVSFPPAACTRAAPTVVLTPAGTVWTAAGALVNYSATVTNNDSCGCASSSFNISGNAPAGWTTTSNSTNSIAPGTSIAASIAFGVPAATAGGFYSVGVRAASSASTLASSAPGTVALATSLTVSVSTSASYSRPKGKNQVTNASITTTVSTGTAATANAGVMVDVKDPSGAVTTLSAKTGTSGAATVTYPLVATSMVGTYSVTVSSNLGSLTGSASTTFVLK